VDPDQLKATDATAKNVVDLRSDTVTKPTPEMRRAMARSRSGRRRVRRRSDRSIAWKHRAAEIFGREAALFVPSGMHGQH
jgi:threonine aldolase